MLSRRDSSEESDQPAGATAADVRFRRRRRRRLVRVLRRLAAVLAVLGLVAAGVWLLFFSSHLAVQQVAVDGAQVVAADEVRRVAEVPLGVPLATLDLDTYEARVETLPAVRDAQVHRNWPDGVVIEVTERQALAVVQRDGSWRGVDSDGVVFRSYPRKPPLPQVEMTATTSVEALAEAAAVVSALPPGILARVESLDVGSIDDISFELRNGVVVTWGSADESSDKARVLERLLPQGASAYDVTAPGRPSIRP